jgi:hypothetical protein
MHSFVAEIDGKPLIAFQAKNKDEAKAFVERGKIREELRALQRGGKPVWDGVADFTVRAANKAERRQLTLAMLSIGLMAKRINFDFWVSLISAQI